PAKTWPWLGPEDREHVSTAHRPGRAVLHVPTQATRQDRRRREDLPMEPRAVSRVRGWSPTPPACVGDLEPATIQAWVDSMAAADLALGTMRVRQSTLSSLCAFLVKRGHLDTNPVARLDRPPHRREARRQVPGPSIMDALGKAAQQRKRPREVAIFLILRYSGVRRESVAT